MFVFTVTFDQSNESLLNININFLNKTKHFQLRETLLNEYKCSGDTKTMGWNTSALVKCKMRISAGQVDDKWGSRAQNAAERDERVKHVQRCICCNKEAVLHKHKTQDLWA